MQSCQNVTAISVSSAILLEEKICIKQEFSTCVFLTHLGVEK